MMVDNVQSVINRGEKLDDVSLRANDLENEVRLSPILLYLSVLMYE